MEFKKLCVTLCLLSVTLCKFFSFEIYCVTFYS